MTKKHFESMAKILLETDLDHNNLVIEFGRYFETINPNFDYTKWVIACGAASKINLKEG